MLLCTYATWHLDTTLHCQSSIRKSLFNSICKADISLHATREHYPQLGQDDPLFLEPHVLDHAYLVLVSECTQST